MQKFINWGVASLLALIGGAASAQVAVYDTSTALLTVPSVQVGAETYTNVILKNSFVFTLQDATEQSPAGKGYATYDLQTMVLLPVFSLTHFLLITSALIVEIENISVTNKTSSFIWQSLSLSIYKPL